MEKTDLKLPFLLKKVQYDSFAKANPCSPFLIINSDDIQVASVQKEYLEYNGGSYKEAEANAELICTAVNAYYPMLEALKNTETLLEFAINATPTGAVRNLLTEANIRTKEAIFKAESKKELAE